MRTSLSTARVIEVIRLGYGAAQLLCPRAVARAVGADTDAVSMTVRRVLGVRHLVQGAVLIDGGQAAHKVGAAVDVAHAISMFGWAAAHRSRRRGAILNGLSAGGFALAESHAANSLST